MSETEQLRAEVAELRTAVLHLAHNANAFRFGMWNIPNGREVGAGDAVQDHRNLTVLCYGLGSIPENTANIVGAPWLVAIERRSGTSFDEFHKKNREVIERENTERRARWKLAQAEAEREGGE